MFSSIFKTSAFVLKSVLKSRKVRAQIQSRIHQGVDVVFQHMDDEAICPTCHGRGTLRNTAPASQPPHRTPDPPTNITNPTV